MVLGCRILWGVGSPGVWDIKGCGKFLGVGWPEMWDGLGCLKSQVVYSKQPKLRLTQEFVVDCAHALWEVHSIKRLVSLMLPKWFLSDSFIYFMYKMINENC